MPAPTSIPPLARTLTDGRSGEVVFLSHCLLNEHTRYLGGASRPACVESIVAQCVDERLGMVQMPCPEERSWGGVLKRRFLALYGLSARHPVLGPLLAPLIATLAERYSRLAYRRLADGVARQARDYLDAGYHIRAVVAVDGSPSCGLRSRIDFASLAEFMALEPTDVTVEATNDILRRHTRDGQGLFTSELQRALRRRGVRVHFLAHDLPGERAGTPSTLNLGDP
ncbi:MAG: 2-thiouracil desulfurase family protein [Dehalococcoidia bacterium]